MADDPSGRRFGNRHHALARLASFVAISTFVCAAQATEFSTGFLNTKDKHNIDLSTFSRDGYIAPGSYLRYQLSLGRPLFGGTSGNHVLHPLQFIQSEICVPLSRDRGFSPPWLEPLLNG